MLTAHWRPCGMTQWNQLQNEMDRLFGRLSNEFDGPSLAATYPLVNVWEDANNVFVEAELPGMDLNKLEIYVSEGNQLTIQGERQSSESEQGTWHRQERGFGKFSRTIILPIGVNADKVEARLDQGVLRITLPKSESARPRQIKVRGE
jgi:HSP20 family protein